MLPSLLLLLSRYSSENQTGSVKTTENGGSKIERVQSNCHSLRTIQRSLSSYSRRASTIILDRIVSKSKCFARSLTISLIESNSVAMSLTALNPAQALRLYSILCSQLNCRLLTLSIQLHYLPKLTNGLKIKKQEQ